MTNKHDQNQNPDTPRNLVEQNTSRNQREPGQQDQDNQKKKGPGQENEEEE
jgi:hypothetical protein